MVAYKKGLNKVIIIKTTKLLGIGLPIAILPSYFLFFRNKDIFTNFVDKTSTLQILLILIGLASVISILGILIYRRTNKIIYGSYLSKLDDIISDMESIKQING